MKQRESNIRKMLIRIKSFLNLKLLVAVGATLFLVSCGSVNTNITNSEAIESSTQTETSDEIQSSIVETTEHTDSSEVAEVTDNKLKEKTETTDNKNVSEMQVHFIDVGQGDSSLITCDGHAMLIDAGDNNKGTTVQLYLKKQGVKKLDYLILTHPDADHIGGADVIVTKFDIENVFMSSFTKDNKTYNELIDALDYKSIKWSTPTVGDTYSLGSAKFTIIAPNNNYSDPNNSSVGLVLRNGDNGFLFTGDAEEDAENDILANEISIDVDVYQVGHHGSRTASSKALLNAVTPTWAVISCGEDNTYGHPHAEILNNFRTMGIKVFRTDEQGSIIATSDGKKITWNCSPSETWQAGEPKGTISKSKDNTNTVTEKKSTPKETAKAETKNDNSATAVVPVPQNESAPVADAGNGNVTVHITETGKKYHNAGCQYLKSSDFEVTLQDAKSRGLTPCSKCNPPQ